LFLGHFIHGLEEKKNIHRGAVSTSFMGLKKRKTFTVVL
jgi:hypothetical protein